MRADLDSLYGRPAPIWWRAIVVGAWILFWETAIRFAVDPLVVPSAVELALDLGARSVCLGAALLVPALSLAAFLHLPGRIPAMITGFVARCHALLFQPWRVARLLGLYAVVAVALGSRFIWIGAFMMALVPLAIAAVLELLVALWRARGTRPTAASTAASLSFAAMLTVTGVFYLPRLSATWAEILNLIAIFAVCPTPRLSARSRLGVGAVAAAVLVGGLGLQATRPQLRRHLATYTPYSELGLQALLFATDFDRDGSSGWLGLDCDDTDPERSPETTDLPDDGIDQNCTGADASTERAVARTRAGGPREPWRVRGRPESRPDVILITFDALRQDAYWSNMPETRAWADPRCVQFTQARSNATYTEMAVLALRTGMIPRHLHRGDGVFLMPGDKDRGQPALPPTIASTLGGVGYSTRAVLTLPGQPPYVQLGIDDVRVPPRDHGRPARAPAVFEIARQMLAQKGDAPLFLWLHLFDPHAPYPGGGTSVADYHRTLAQLDPLVRGFLDDLGEAPLIVMTSDHGEGFGEHGSYGHGFTLFDPESRVPLVLCPPVDGRPGPPRPVETLVSHIDILPTIADLVGVQINYPLHGESLLPHLADGAALRSPWVVGEIARAGNHQQSYQVGCHKWVRNLAYEWEATFDTCQNPAETRDLSSAEPETHARLRAAFATVLDHDLDAYRSWRFGDRTAF